MESAGARRQQAFAQESPGVLHTPALGTLRTGSPHGISISLCPP